MSDENNDTTVTPYPASRKTAWVAIGAVSTFAVIFAGIPFLGLITLGALAIPLAMEIHKHGKNNILNRAWQELKPSMMLVKSDIQKLYQRDPGLTPEKFDHMFYKGGRTAWWDNGKKLNRDFKSEKTPASEQAPTAKPDNTPRM